MTDTAGPVPPFPGFPGFPPAEMLDRMWGMMRLTPFGSAFPGVEPGAAQGFGPSLSMMSDMMAPLTNVEELDKRITDMRAVEQWLKLNLNMLQSAIQALEVQRATLATLRAFGAFAEAQMTPPPAATSSDDDRGAQRATPESQDTRRQRADDARAGAESTEAPAGGAQAPAFDAGAWWNLLQSQFNQLAQFAMAQPAAAAQGMAQAAAGADKPAASGAKEAQAGAEAAASPGAAKRSAGRSASPRAAKKTPPKPE